MNIKGVAVITILLLTIFSYSAYANANPAPAQFNQVDKQNGVSLYTGDMALSIPVMVVPGRNGLDFPITLDYKSGVIVSEQASSVGLGWNLEAGAISRGVIGVPDDYERGQNNCDIYSVCADGTPIKTELLCKNIEIKPYVADGNFWEWLNKVFKTIISGGIYFRVGTDGVDVDFARFTINVASSIVGNIELEPNQMNYVDSQGFLRIDNTKKEDEKSCNEISCPDYYTDICSEKIDKYYNSETKSDWDSPDMYWIEGSFLSGKMTVGSDDLKTKKFHLFRASGNESNAGPDAAEITNTFSNTGTGYSGLASFAVNTADGTRYSYGKRLLFYDGGSTVYNGNCGDSTGKIYSKLLEPYSYRWLLTQISNGNTDDNYIKINYQDYYDYDLKNPLGDGCADGPTGNVIQSAYSYEYALIDNIETPTHKAVFTYSNRLDGRETSPGTAHLQKLDKITLYAKNSDGSLEMMGETRFGYDYSLVHGTPNSDAAGQGKLTLISITQCGKNNACLPPMELEYANNDPPGTGKNPLWCENCFDRWGYYFDNGDTSKSHNSEGYYADSQGNTIIPDAWSLTKVKWSTGGTTEWEYEPDRYSAVGNFYADIVPGTEFGDTVYGGGLRVKTVKICDGISQCYAKRYLYTKQLTFNENDGVSQTGVLGDSSGVATFEPSNYETIDTDAIVFGGTYATAYVGYYKVFEIPSYDYSKPTETPYGYVEHIFASPKDYPNTGVPRVYGEATEGCGENTNLSIAPNPAKGNVIFYSSKPNTKYTFYNGISQVVNEFTTGPDGFITINTAKNRYGQDISDGVYYLRDSSGCSITVNVITGRSCLDSDSNNICDVIQRPTGQKFSGSTDVDYMRGLETYTNIFSADGINISSTQTTFNTEIQTGLQLNNRNFTTGWAKANKTVTKVQGITKETQVLRYNKNGQPELIYEKNNDGSARFTETVYAHDIYCSSGTSCLPSAGFSMETSHMWSQPYSTTVYEDTNKNGKLEKTLDNAYSTQKITYAKFGSYIKPATSEILLDDGDKRFTTYDKILKTQYISYDTHGNLLESKDPMLRTTKLYYGDNNNPCSNTPASMHNAYLTCTENELGHKAKIFYNQDGTVWKTSDVNSLETIYSYDDLNRLQSIQLPGLSNPTTAYEYYYAKENGGINSNNMNYVMATTNMDDTTYMTSAQYADGLGRPVQSASVESPTSVLRSNTYYNEISAVEFQTKTFRDTSSTGIPVDGRPVLQPLSVQAPYVLGVAIEYEKDPLARPAVTIAPGQAETYAIIDTNVFSNLQACNSNTATQALSVQKPGYYGWAYTSDAPGKGYASLYIGSNANGMKILYANSTYSDKIFLDSGSYYIEIKRTGSGCSTLAISNIYEKKGVMSNEYISDGKNIANVAIDEEGRINVDHYDSFGNLVLSEVAKGTSYYAINAFKYNIMGGMEQFINTKGQKNINVYDSLSRLEAAADVDSNWIVNAYDDNGKIILGNRNGQLTGFIYDQIDRPTGIDYGNDRNSGGTVEIEYRYDSYNLSCPAPETNEMQAPAGYSTQTKDSSGFSCYYYDKERGNLVRKVIKLGSPGSERIYEIRVLYDNANNIRSMIYPNGKVVSYVYNQLNQVAQLGLAPNAGFETDTGKDYMPSETYDNAATNDNKPDGWSTDPWWWRGGSQTERSGFDTSVKYSGARSIKVYSEDGAAGDQYQGYAYVDVAVTDGDKIEVSGWVKVDFTSGTAGYAGIITQCADANHNVVFGAVCRMGTQVGTFTSDQDWTKVSSRFTADFDSPVKYLRILCLNQGDAGHTANLWCDNIAVNGETVEYSYTETGKIESMMFNNGVKTAFQYDQQERITQTKTTGYLFRLPTYTNGVPTSYTLKPGEFTENLQYDNVGNIIKITTPEFRNANFSYDSRNRLTAVTNSIGRFYDEIFYTYDTGGNRLTQNSLNTVKSYTYESKSILNNAQTSHLLSVQLTPTLKISYTYDDNGNVIKKIGPDKFSLCDSAHNMISGQDDATPNEYLLFGIDAAVGTNVKIVYESKKDNARYEWNTVVEDYTQVPDHNRLCTAQYQSNVPVMTFARISTNNIAGTGPSASWYNADQYTTRFNIYSSNNKTTSYYYNFDNELMQIIYNDGACSKYFYDAGGMRTIKQEIGTDGAGTTVYYVYSGGNVIMDETFSDSGLSCAAPATSTHNFLGKSRIIPGELTGLWPTVTSGGGSGGGGTSRPPPMTCDGKKCPPPTLENIP